MRKIKFNRTSIILTCLSVNFIFITLSSLAETVSASSSELNTGCSWSDKIYIPPKKLKPIDSVLKVSVGEEAPGFNLPSVNNGDINLSDYRNKKNIVLSFIPAAWTPVCSGQWPSYKSDYDQIQKYDAEIIGISIDNIPSLYAWEKEMGGLPFPVCSDFYPHGATASKYGVLRSNGTAERAVFIIDKHSIIRFIKVYDINQSPPIEELLNELKKLDKI